MIGTPSSRGRGMVRTLPTLVPTHRRPLQANNDVTITDARLLFSESLEPAKRLHLVIVEAVMLIMLISKRKPRQWEPLV